MFHSHYDDEEFGRATELQNCLAEALPYAIMQRGEVVPEGTGHIFITVRTAVFCKSTDAYAGTMLSHIHRVSSHEEADAWIEANLDREMDQATVTPAKDSKCAISTKEFSFRDNVFSAEASSLRGLAPVRAGNSVAFDLVSARTGSVLRVTRTKVERDGEGDVCWEEFAPASGNFKVVIFND